MANQLVGQISDYKDYKKPYEFEYIAKSIFSHSYIMVSDAFYRKLQYLLHPTDH